VKPRVLLVARDRYDLPLSPSRARKFDALAEVLDVRMLAVGTGSGDDRFTLLPVLPRLDGPAYWSLLPPRVALEARRFRADVVIAQSPFEGAVALAARVPARVVVELHGDWRTFARLYGSPLRRVLAVPLDRVGTWAVRRADAVRTVSAYTTALAREVGVEPAATFPAFMDLEPFLRAPEPLPERPSALFVGVLEPYKNIDGLAAAWRIVRDRLPDARLRIVGSGTRADVVEALVRDGLATWDRSLSTNEVARAMDDASVVVLPSRSEGMGRVVVEALLRGRPVVGANVGGIRDLVQDGVNGLLVEPTPDSIADGLARVLGNGEVTARLAAAAPATAAPWVATPEEYARRTADLVARVLS
jgi:glycosyltransferase involved in cell wall biosynthesis